MLGDKCRQRFSKKTRDKPYIGANRRQFLSEVKCAGFRARVPVFRQPYKRVESEPNYVWFQVRKKIDRVPLVNTKFQKQTICVFKLNGSHAKICVLPLKGVAFAR